MARLFGRFAVATPLAFLMATCQPADARRIVVDTTLNPFTPCVVGSACSGIDLGFTVNAGDGATSKIYIYANGIATVGSPLSTSFAGASSIAAIGQDALTPAYSKAGTASGFKDGTGTSQSFSPFPGSTFFRTDYTSTFVDSAHATDSVLVEFTIYQLTDGTPGDFALEYAYSDVNDQFSAPTAPLDPNALIGFTLGTHLVDTKAGNDTAAIQSADDTFQYVFRNTPAAAVPEASTWLMLVGGFGLVGAAMRRPSVRLVLGKS